MFRSYERMVYSLSQSWPSQLFDAIKLTFAITAADSACFVFREPSHQMMGMSSVLASHAPSEPLRERNASKT